MLEIKSSIRAIISLFDLLAYRTNEKHQFKNINLLQKLENTKHGT